MKSYKVKKPVNLPNDLAQQWQDYEEDGYFYKYSLENIPLEKIIYKKWNQRRYDSVMVALEKGTPMPPVELGRRGSRYEIGDGNHRVAASIDFGFTHIPAVVGRQTKGQPSEAPPSDYAQRKMERELFFAVQKIRNEVSGRVFVDKDVYFVYQKAASDYYVIGINIGYDDYELTIHKNPGDEKATGRSTVLGERFGHKGRVDDILSKFLLFLAPLLEKG